MKTTILVALLAISAPVLSDTPSTAVQGPEATRANDEIAFFGSWRNYSPWRNNGNGGCSSYGGWGC